MCECNCDLKSKIRDIPDFPKPGILFKDITPLLQDRVSFAKAVERMAEPYQGQGIDTVVCIESRGFILGAPVAYRLGVGMVPVRKPKKLPYTTCRATYDLEYGTDTLEIHSDAITPGQRVLLVDDLLATGGTAQAVTGLIEQLGGKICGISFLVELEFLHGRNKLQNYDIRSLIKF